MIDGFALIAAIEPSQAKAPKLTDAFTPSPAADSQS